MRTAWDRVAAPVSAAVAIHLLFVAVHLAKNAGDLSILVCSGVRWASHPTYRFLTRTSGPSGYDGQFYYAYAQAPWDRHDRDEIDLPAPRHFRILYPAICWSLSGGEGRALLYVMPAVNLAAVAAMAWLATLLAMHYGMSPWWGLLFPLAINAGLPLLHNLTDCLAALAVFGLLCAWMTRASWWVLMFWFAATVFSREQNWAVAGVVFLAAAWSGRYSILAGFAGVIVCLLAWIGYLHALYGAWPIIHARGHFHLPGYGMWYCWHHLGGPGRFSTRLAIIQAAGMIHLMLLVAMGIYLAFRQPSRTVALTLLGGCALALLGGRFIYEDFWSYTRVFVWLPIGIWLATVQLRIRWPSGVLAFSALWPMMAALGYV